MNNRATESLEVLEKELKDGNKLMDQMEKDGFLPLREEIKFMEAENEYNEYVKTAENELLQHFDSKDLDIATTAESAEKIAFEILKLVNTIILKKIAYADAINIIQVLQSEMNNILATFTKEEEKQIFLNFVEEDKLTRLKKMDELLKSFNGFKLPDNLAFEFQAHFEKVQKSTKDGVIKFKTLRNAISAFNHNLANVNENLNQLALNLLQDQKNAFETNLIESIDSYLTERAKAYKALDSLDHALHTLFSCFGYKTEKQKREEYASHLKEAVKTYSQDGKIENKNVLRTLLASGMAIFKPRSNNKESDDYKKSFKAVLEGIDIKIK